MQPELQKEIASKIIARFGMIRNNANTKGNVSLFVKKEYPDLSDENVTVMSDYYQLFIEHRRVEFHKKKEEELRKAKEQKEALVLMEQINNDLRRETGHSLIAHFIHGFNCAQLRYQFPA